LSYNSLNIIKNEIKDELKFNGETLLTYRIEYPELRSFCYRSCVQKVNKFYKDMAYDFKNYCETYMFGMAIMQYKEAIEHGFPVRVFDAVMAYEPTYLGSCIFSIYFDRYQYTGGAHGNTIRASQTWNLSTCQTVKLNELVNCLPNNRTYILTQVAAQIEKNPDIYFENYIELIAESFNENSFYCTPNGVVIYYQQYDIAPYSSGIREFLIPYSNCVKNPSKLCCKNSSK